MIFEGGSVRQSLNQLRVSLNRSLIPPQIDTDTKEELRINEHDVRDLREQLNMLHSSCDDDCQEASESNIFRGPTESFAASLQRGLEIIDNHQHNSVLDKSLVAFSFEHLATKTNDASAQTSTENKGYICSTSQQRAPNDVQDSLKTLNVPGTSNNEAETMKKGKDLEILCMEQKAEIEKLNNLVSQYKQGEITLDELRKQQCNKGQFTAHQIEKYTTLSNY